MKVMVTCPPMLGLIDEFRATFADKGIELVTPNVVQTLSEDELCELLPQMDGWIVGDDPATERVFTAGKAGNLKAVVKWGVGVDNVDFRACRKLDIPIINTPNMFGAEVAGIAVNYVIGLARQTFLIHQGVKEGKWLKPPGISLTGRTVALIGYGDIGRQTAKRLHAFDLKINAYDPFAKPTREEMKHYSFKKWPQCLEEADFVVITCALTPDTMHMINADTIDQMKDEVRIVNVSRGPVIDENALIEGLKSGKVHSAGLDVFETEPLPMDSELRTFERNIFGTHNGSNTIDGVRRATAEAINSLFGFLKIS